MMALHVTVIIYDLMTPLPVTVLIYDKMTSLHVNEEILLWRHWMILQWYTMLWCHYALQSKWPSLNVNAEILLWRHCMLLQWYTTWWRHYALQRQYEVNWHLNGSHQGLLSLVKIIYTNVCLFEKFKSIKFMSLIVGKHFIKVLFICFSHYEMLILLLKSG